MSVLPVLQPSNLKLKKFFRKVVYCHKVFKFDLNGSSIFFDFYKASLRKKKNFLFLSKKKKKYIPVFLIISLGKGLLRAPHFNSFYRIFQKSLKFSKYGHKKNLLNLCFLHKKILNFSISKKANGVRMGKGKGGINNWVSSVNSGDVIYSVNSGSNFFNTFSWLTQLKFRFPFKICIIYTGSFYRFNIF